MTKWMWGGIVALVAAVTIIAVATSGGAPPEQAAKQQKTTQRDYCAQDKAVIYFDKDDEAQAAHDEIVADTRIVPATQASNYARFLEAFADNEGLIDDTRPGAIPASVSVQPATGPDATTVADRLRTGSPGSTETRGMPCSPK